MKLTRRLSLVEVFVVPFALGVATTIGLVTALLGAGFWDIASWIGLAAPVVVMLRSYWRSRAASKASSNSPLASSTNQSRGATVS